MTPSTEKDLTSITTALEHLVKRWDTLPLTERVDIAARLNASRKTMEAVDKTFKEEVKTRRKSQAGYIIGERFKACLQLIPVRRLDQQKLKVDYNNIFEECCKDDEDQRVTYEAR